MQTLSEWRTEERADGTWFVVNLAELGFRIEDNGTTSGAFMAVAAPRGIVGGMPALLKGPPGFPISLVLSSFIELAEGDPTPASASINILTPATDVSGPVYGLDLALHAGATGADGTTVISPTDYAESPVAGQMLIVAPGGETFALAYQKVDGIYVPPAAISSKTVGTDVNFTMAQVGFDARPNVWYPEPVGEVTIEATTTNIRVDLVARLNAADGDVLGRCSGVGGMLKERLTLIPVRNPGAADSVGRVDVGQSATVFFCVEKQSGTAQYTVSNSTARFGAKAVYV